VIIAFAAFVVTLFLYGDASGIISASYAQSQKDEEESTESASSPQQAIDDRMESVADLVEDQPVTRAVREALRQRELKVSLREKEVARRERELQALRKVIEEKLAQLEAERTNLEELTKEIDEERVIELDAAVKIYKAMEPQDSAKFFNQMELELVVAVLKRMSAIQAGEILKEMRTDIETRYPDQADAQAKQQELERLKKIGEIIVDSTVAAQ
ncbi:MAG: MotE family protein, partial [Candidatus Sumerlaeota bacterium]